jgi:hypothetical protein
MTDQELIDYYVGLLIIQYATQPNAVATIAALIGTLIQGQIIAQIGNGFLFTVDPVGQPIDGAVGVQLDAIAAYRGAQRTLFGLTPQDYFEMFDAGGSAYIANGFMDAPDDPLLTTWLFLTAQDTAQPIYSMSDNELYRLTQLRAQLHQCDMSIESIDDIIFKFFGTNVTMIDNGNMTMYYVDLNSDMDTLFSIALQTQSLPRPAGVQMQAFRADLLTDFFGLQDAEQDYDPTFSGFSDALLTLTTGTFISAP